MSAPPPHDLEAEAELVAALVFYRSEALPLTATVEPGDFYSPVFSTLWATTVEMIQRGEPVAFRTLRSALPDVSKETLVEVTTTAKAPTLAVARRVAERVAELASRRRLLSAAVALAHGARDLTTDITQVRDDASASIASAGSPVAVVPPGPDLMAFFEDDDEEPTWVVPGMIGRRDRILLVGEEGRGKSETLRQICVQVAAGLQPFSDDRYIEPQPTMLVDAENPRYEVKRALEKLYLTAGSRLNPSMMTVHCRPEGVNLLDRGDRRWLTERLAANRPALLTMGPLYKLHDDDPTDEKPARRVAAVLDDLRTRFDFALLLEAHAPHATQGGKRTLRPYGASLWMRWPDMGPALHLEEGDGGKDQWMFRPWRPARGERYWPGRVLRGGEWPWLASALLGLPRQVIAQEELLPGPMEAGTGNGH